MNSAIMMVQSIYINKTYMSNDDNTANNITNVLQTMVEVDVSDEHLLINEQSIDDNNGNRIQLSEIVEDSDVSKISKDQDDAF